MERFPGRLGSGAGVGQEFRNRHSAHRVNPVGGNLGEGSQDEAPLPESWMRHHEACFLQNQIGIENQIQIERPWRVRDGTHAAEPAFDLEERVEQIARCQRGDTSCRCIEEARLIRQADGGRVVECRNPEVVDVIVKGNDRSTKGLLAIAQIAA